MRCYQMKPGTSTATVAAGDTLGFQAAAQVRYTVLKLLFGMISLMLLLGIPFRTGAVLYGKSEWSSFA